MPPTNPGCPGRAAEGMAMGDLMHRLHADQQRLEVCAETIPGLLVQHFDAPAVRSPSELRLMTINAEQRELIEALTERNAVLTRRVADLSQDLRTMKGENATPDRGCCIARVILGDCYALVEYEHQPAEEPIYDVASPVCGPGHPEELTPLRVMLNGHWCDLEDVRGALDEQRLIERIYDARGQA